MDRHYIYYLSPVEAPASHLLTGQLLFLVKTLARGWVIGVTGKGTRNTSYCNLTLGRVFLSRFLPTSILARTKAPLAFLSGNSNPESILNVS
jgi:hypothetical protein